MFNRFLLGLSCCVYVFPINRLLNLQVVNFTAQCRSIRNNPNGPARQGVLINSRREVECREAAHKKCQVMKFLGSGPQNFGKKNVELQHITRIRTFREDLSWCKKGLSISKNRKFQYVFNWKVEKSRMRCLSFEMLLDPSIGKWRSWPIPCTSHLYWAVGCIALNWRLLLTLTNLKLTCKLTWTMYRSYQPQITIATSTSWNLENK